MSRRNSRFADARAPLRARRDGARRREKAARRRFRPRLRGLRAKTAPRPAPVLADTATASSSIFACGLRSILFATLSVLAPVWAASICRASARGGGSPPASKTSKTTSAVSVSRRARAIPKASISSGSSRQPAVSTSRIGRPSIANDSRKASRVAPGKGETIAASCPNKRLKIDDFPTFGAPTIASETPSVKRRALWVWATSESKAAAMAGMRDSQSAGRSISSSAKSIAPSAKTRASITCRAMARAAREKSLAKRGGRRGRRFRFARE